MLLPLSINQMCLVSCKRCSNAAIKSFTMASRDKPDAESPKSPITNSTPGNADTILSTLSVNRLPEFSTTDPPDDPPINNRCMKAKGSWSVSKHFSRTTSTCSFLDCISWFFTSTKILESPIRPSSSTQTEPPESKAKTISWTTFLCCVDNGKFKNGFLAWMSISEWSSNISIWGALMYVPTTTNPMDMIQCQLLNNPIGKANDNPIIVHTKITDKLFKSPCPWNSWAVRGDSLHAVYTIDIVNGMAIHIPPAEWARTNGKNNHAKAPANIVGNNRDHCNSLLGIKAWITTSNLLNAHPKIKMGPFNNTNANTQDHCIEGRYGIWTVSFSNIKDACPQSTW